MIELTIYDECSGKAELIGMELEDRQVKKIKVRWINRCPCYPNQIFPNGENAIEEYRAEEIYEMKRIA